MVLPDPGEPSDLGKQEAQQHYINWCREWHRDPEDVGSMTAYEEEFHEPHEDDGYET